MTTNDAPVLGPVIAACIATVLAWPTITRSAHASSEILGQPPQPSAIETVTFLNGLFSCAFRNSSSTKDPEREWMEGSRHVTATTTIELQNGVTLKLVVKIQDNTDWLNTSTYKSFGSAKDYVYTAQAALSQLDPEVKVNGTEVRVNCNPTFGSCFSVSQRGTSKTYVPSGKEVASQIDETTTATYNAFMFCNDDNAARGARAFTHLMTISGAKKSLF